jgi:peptidyl-tRNA hydrolase, PTH1 family
MTTTAEATAAVTAEATPEVATGAVAMEAAEAAISRWSLRRRRREDGGARTPRVDALIVGLGNPGGEYAGTRHNLGFEVAAELSRRWELPKANKRYGGLITDGRTGVGGPRVAILLPQTYMNESGTAAGPARGELRVPLDHVIVLHDEIDLPFGEVRSKLGGGVAGHNGLKSLKEGLGGTDFWRVRGGVGRPDSTDPEIVSNHVLSRFRESDEEVRALIGAAADEAERLVERLAGDAEAAEELG